MKHGFTLIEIIIVIIIVGILAAVGIDQYGKTVEKGRSAEAKMIIGKVRTLAYQYHLENGAMTGLANANVNIGVGSDQIPSACRGTYYFSYQAWACDNPTRIVCVWAKRCTSGGKSPQSSSACISLKANAVTGADQWGTCW
ncbi:MAG: prepilin-type N-terminal cleavage/methylation domain-containing protein [Candidatus Omnitrophica bacterium]|nr:prepilin-type N-terminal cleavage/methylation domain-containing protein [Candidatus Omnitrophota bacterium]